MTAVPEVRFPEFDSALRESKVSAHAKVKTGSRDTKDRVEDGAYPFFVRSDNVEAINSYAMDGVAVLTSGDGVGVGKNFHYVDGKFDYHQRVYAIFDFSGDLDAKYFYHFFSRNFYRHVIRQSAKNSVDSVRMSMITDMPLPLPTLPEQQKIAAFLGAVDDKIDALRRKHDGLKQFKAGLMQKLFSQELRFKRDDGSDFPDWEEKRLVDVTLSIESGLSADQNSLGRGVTVTRIETISKSRIDLEKVGYVETAADISRYRLIKGDLLFSNINSVSHIGKMAKVEAGYQLFHGMNLLRIRPDESKVIGDFLYSYLTSVPLNRHFQRVCNQAVSQASINQTELKKTRTIVPQIDEQQKIADCLSAVDAKIEAVDGQITQMEAFKKGLLQKMFV